MVEENKIEKRLKDMYIKPDVDRCKSALAPIQDALYVLNGKWKIPIIVAILEGNTRFGEIQRALNNIAPKVLSHELKELELNNFITRTVYDTMPVVIKYELTGYSDSLGAVVAALRDWGMMHRETIISQMNKK